MSNASIPDADRVRYLSEPSDQGRSDEVTITPESMSAWLVLHCPVGLG